MRFYIYIVTIFITALLQRDANACTGTTLSVFDITADSVTLSWPTAGAVAGYEYEILPASAPQPTTGTVITGLSIRLGGLIPGTAYKAWQRTNCGGGQFSSWISISFSTPCGIPATIGISNVKGDSADINWTQVHPGANYQYAVDTLVSAPASGTPININNVRVKGLKPSKTYYVFVRTDCGSGIYSPWASTSFFTPWSVGVNNITNTPNDISIYPNPVTDILHFNFTIKEPHLITVYNSTGSVMLSLTLDADATVADLTQLSSGLYFIKCTGKNSSNSFKILKH